MNTNPEALVLVTIPLSGGRFGTESGREKVFALEAKLARAVRRARTGEHDGHEFGKGEAHIYLYGPDAETLADSIGPTLRRAALPAGSKVYVRPPGGRRRARMGWVRGQAW